MSLDIPELDDRGYADLLADARARIPALAPEWTDHNAHDPGITVLELLAWLAETYRYQLNQVTDDHRLKYLRLLGERPHPPRAATVDLDCSLDTALSSGNGVRLPRGFRVLAEPGLGKSIGFETAAAVSLTRATLERVVSTHRGGRIDNTDVNRTDGVSYPAFGEEAAAGSALYLGFDDDPFAGTGVLDLTVLLDERGLPDPGSHGDEAPAFTPSVELEWQYCVDPDRWFHGDSWRALSVRHDETNSLYESGIVSLEEPPTWPGPTTILNERGTFHWVRCAVETAGHEIPPRVETVGVNVVPARQQSTHGSERLRRPDGGSETTARPGQTFRLAHWPVLDDELDVRVGGEVDGSQGGRFERRTDDEAWTQVIDFDASTPESRHFVLDRTRGEIRFGDEVTGRVPAAEQSVWVAGYTAGGGSAGNVTRAATWRVDAEPTGRKLEKLGVYTYATDEEHAPPEGTMRGAVVVGDTADTGTLDDWLGTDETVEDARGREEVVVEVGASRPDGRVGFSPAAVRVDPGTLVRFVWVAAGHPIVVDTQPPGGAWEGHPTPEPAGYEYRYRFQDSLARSAVGVSPRGDATGGTNAESIDDAFARVRRGLTDPFRAVTAADYATVVMNTPGIRVGRAHATVTQRNRIDECEPQSEIRVVVVPYSTRPRPEPSDGFLRAARSHLRSHRLLTDRVDVVAPAYVGVGVGAELVLTRTASVTRTLEAVDRELDAFLHPLSGFDGTGWPFGRSLYRGELYEVVEGVPGVECVFALSITTRGTYTRSLDGAIDIDENVLLYALDHELTVRTDRADCEGGG